MEAEFSVLAEFFGGAGRKNLERPGNTESLSPVLVSLSPLRARYLDNTVRLVSANSDVQFPVFTKIVSVFTIS